MFYLSFLTDSIMEKDFEYICAQEETNTLKLLRDAGYGYGRDVTTNSIQVNSMHTQLISMF